MQRRKFIIGTGALATGSAAAVGTGAFDLVSARRDFEVEAVGDDAGAFLGLQSGPESEETSEYAEVNGDTLELDFSNDRADGVNKEADTRFDDVFTITNNGDQDVPIRLVEDDEGIGRWSEDLPAAYYSEDGENPFQEDNDFGESPVLSPGESITVSFIFWGGPGEPIGRYEETDLESVDEQDVIGIYADSSDT